MAILEITEILSPASQGKTIPFLCRAEDEQLYYVKGKGTGRRGQFCEWVVAHLAESFGLPVPPFRVVMVSSELLAESPKEHQILGAGYAFASLAISPAQWLEPSFVMDVPPKLRCEVLAFDWWVKNFDRHFDNPNLLWAAETKELVVIDHAFAFAEDFWPTIFLDHHIFKDDWMTIMSDPVLRSEYVGRMKKALLGWKDSCDAVPVDWTVSARGDMGDEIFDCASAIAILERCASEDLWKTN